MEDWAIWLRWEEAFHLGQTSQESTPALPEDRSRHEVLVERLTRELVSDPTSATHAHGEFRVRPESSKQFGMRELEVRWQVVEDGG